MAADLFYAVDRHDVIDELGGAWMEAARDGGAATALAPERVIGRPLATFLRGDPTRMFVFAMLGGARAHGKPVSRDYRCDSPTERRLMRMTATPLAEHRVRVTHMLVHAEALARRVEIRPASGGARGFFKRCSVCNRLRLGEHWHEPDSAAVATIAGGDSVKVIYGVCEECTSWSAARDVFEAREAAVTLTPTAAACETPRTDRRDAPER